MKWALAVYQFWEQPLGHLWGPINLKLVSNVCVESEINSAVFGENYPQKVCKKCINIYKYIMIYRGKIFKVRFDVVLLPKLKVYANMSQYSTIDKSKFFKISFECLLCLKFYEIYIYYSDTCDKNYLNVYGLIDR